MGWASTTALLLLLGGMILLVLGLIGEYVGRIYMCANAAPQYVAREYTRQSEPTTARKYYVGLDFLKAFAAIFIVAAPLPAVHRHLL